MDRSKRRMRDDRMVVVYEPYVTMCENNVHAAILLDIFKAEHCQLVHCGRSGAQGWTMAELMDASMGLINRRQLKDGLDVLCKKQYLHRRILINNHSEWRIDIDLMREHEDKIING